MSDHDGLIGDDPDEPLGPAGMKALEQERTARKEADRRAKDVEKRNSELLTALQTERFGRYKAQHPWLEEADLDGVPLEQWDSRIERFAAIAGAGTTPPPPPTEEPAPPALTPEQQFMRRFTTNAGGAGPAADQKITWEEAAKLPWHERRSYMERGLVEGVAPPQ